MSTSSPATTAQAFEQEVKAGKRFRFGKNWASFLGTLNDERIRIAEDSLKRMLNIESLEGTSFLDIGSGSGLFSLCARRLGARVHSLDYDPQSVACTTELRRRYFPDSPEWTIARASVLDADYLATLGTFDVVYSWGVLHHTGQMWKAIEHCDPLVKPGGALFLSIYNDQGATSRYWTFVKRTYCSNALGKAGVCAVFIPYFFCRAVVGSILKGRSSFKGYKAGRGMSIHHDWFDWLGGFPFEVAKPEAIFRYFRDRGYTLTELKTTNKLGCNELVFRKSGVDG